MREAICEQQWCLSDQTVKSDQCTVIHYPESNS